MSPADRHSDSPEHAHVRPTHGEAAEAPSNSLGLFRRKGWSKARDGALPPEVARLEAGSMVGEFRLLRPLGEGGMGSVWEAEQSSIGGRRVAVKMIRTDRVNDQMVRYFRREAEAGGVVKHRGIVSVYSSGESNGVHYIAQELVGDGRTLSDWLAAVRQQEKALTPADYREMAEFVAEVAEAVQAAHDAGVVHRDLKPQNILVDDEGDPKVTDFGLAKKLDEQSISRRLDLIGTYYYMSPEQAAAKSFGIDARTDIFSLGIVLYEMLTQRRPFDGDTREVVLERVLHEDPVPAHKVMSRVPEDLSWISLKAMEKRRDDRYGTMAEFAADLRRFLADERIVARDPGVLRRVQKWVRRHPTTSSVVGVAGAAFTVVVLLLSVISGKNIELKSTNDELASKNEELDETNDELAGANKTLMRTNEDLEESRAEARAKATEAREYADSATEAAALAETREREAHAELDRRRRLSDLTLLRQLQAREERLWPARPEMAEAMAQWLDDAAALRARLPAHEQQLARLREGAADIDEAALEEALGQSPHLQEYEDAETLLTRVEEQLVALAATIEDDSGREESELAPPLRKERRARLEALRARCVSACLDIEEVARESIRWRFPGDPDAQFRHHNLTALVEGANALLDEESGLVRSVRDRLERAERIEDETIAEEFDAWLEAMDGIASNEKYQSWELPQEQIGLVPIGVDPDSDLWEFWHVESGTRPERDAGTGRIAVTEEMGIVLVLIPGGAFWMGAENDPQSPNFDSDARAEEGPVHEVTLEPYLISKYELTQGQWFRLTGKRPSDYAAGTTWGGKALVDSNPVTNLSWEECATVLPRYGLRLPTEAQWERACRAGTTSPYWSGDRDSIAGPEGFAGNLFDEASVARGAPESWGPRETWDDGHIVHASVGSFRKNPFGLYDVLGNVWEWCDDWYAGNAYASVPADPRHGRRLIGPRTMDGLRYRVYRGECFDGAAIDFRSAVRYGTSPTDLDATLGVRPACAIAQD